MIILSRFFFSENQNLGPENADDIIVDDTADILNEEITLDEIISSIKTLKNGKSAGPDLLSAEFYKSTCSEIAPILKDLFNSILDTGVRPFYAPYIKVGLPVIQIIFEALH